MQAGKCFTFSSLLKKCKFFNRYVINQNKFESPIFSKQLVVVNYEGNPQRPLHSIFFIIFCHLLLQIQELQLQKM